jgi:hydrogenase nickel incorporation protein HypA/HybF
MPPPTRVRRVSLPSHWRALVHELGITQSLVEACCDAVADAAVTRVKRVTVEIGCLCGVLPQAVRFCYDVCVQGTLLEGSELHIVSVPGQGRCRDCGTEMIAEDFLSLCKCGSANIQVTGGDELRIRQMETA